MIIIKSIIIRWTFIWFNINLELLLTIILLRTSGWFLLNFYFVLSLWNEVYIYIFITSYFLGLWLAISKKYFIPLDWEYFLYICCFPASRYDFDHWETLLQSYFLFSNLLFEQICFVDFKIYFGVFISQITQIKIVDQNYCNDYLFVPRYR